MQEHSGQVRGQARAPVGRPSKGAGFGPGGALASRPTAPRANPPSRRQHFTGGIHPHNRLPLRRARLRPRVRSAVRARPWALAKVREPSHPHLAPDTERCHVFTDSGDLAWVSCPSPLPAPGLPTWRPARPGPWVWSHRKGPWANSSSLRPGDNAVSVQSKFSRYHGAQKDWALPRRALQLQVAPRLFSLGG